MSGRHVVQPIDGTEDIPLPGFYPCLTLQLNLTAYRAEQAGRFVCVTRLPSESYEIRRDHQETGEWYAGVETMRLALGRQIRDIEYLMGFRQVKSL